MRIVSRSEWGARFDRGSGPALLPARYLYIHHSVTPARNGPEVIRGLEAIGQSRFGRGISYTFAVTPDGTVYEGHGIDRKGTHTGGLNSTARAICAVGNYDADLPPKELMEGIAALAAHGTREGWWPGITGGHRDAPGAKTACPGRYLYAAIPAIRDLAHRLTAAVVVPPPPVTNDPPDREELLMAAALDDNDARLALIRQWYDDFLFRAPAGDDEIAIHLWVFATQGASACIAGIAGSEEAKVVRARKRAHMGLVT